MGLEQHGCMLVLSRHTRVMTAGIHGSAASKGMRSTRSGGGWYT